MISTHLEVTYINVSMSVFLVTLKLDVQEVRISSGTKKIIVLVVPSVTYQERLQTKLV